MANINEEARIPVYLNDNQAVSALKNLTGEAEKWKKEMYKAMAAGDPKGVKQAERELKKATAAANKLKKETFDVNKVLNNLSSASITDLRKAMSRLRSEQKGLNRDSKEYAALNKKIGAIKDEFKKINGHVSTQGGLLARLKNSAAGLLPAFSLAAIVSGLAGIGRAMVRVRAEFEKYEAVLTNSLGDRKKAREELQMLQEFASKTPFALTELTGAFVKLTNYGLKPTRDELQQMGDLAASVGKGFDQLTEAMADAVTGEFERLKEFGIKARKEGDLISFTFKEQTTTVENSAAAIKQYILSLGQLEGVSGSMEAISKTVGGKISNMGDAWDNMLNKMGERTGGVMKYIVDTMTGGINRVSKQIEILNSDQLSFWQKWWGSTIGTNAVYDKMIEKQKQSAELAEKRKKAEEAIFNMFGVSTPENSNVAPQTATSKTASTNKTASDSKTSSTAGKSGFDFSNYSTETDAPLEVESWMTEESKAMANYLAEKEAGEEEWTEFLKNMIEERTASRLKELEIEQEISDARQEINQIMIDGVSGIAGALSSMAREGTAAHIALLALEKAAAIANIWINLAKEKAAINAAAAAMGPFGIPYAATMTAKAIANAGVNTGLVVAQTIAGMKKGKKEGGYTLGSNSDDQVAGIVHANEFVANADAVRNPTIKPFLDIINLAQLSGNVARMNFAAETSRKGFQSGGYSTPGQTVIPGTDPALIHVLGELRQEIENLRSWRPDIPITDVRKKLNQLGKRDSAMGY